MVKLSRRSYRGGSGYTSGASYGEFVNGPPAAASSAAANAVAL